MAALEAAGLGVAEVEGVASGKRSRGSIGVESRAV
jgi:hypothetical protein